MGLPVRRPARSSCSTSDSCPWPRPWTGSTSRVASAGFSSRVFTITASTLSSVTVRAAPGRGSSNNPSRRFSTNRRRHLPTVAWFIRRSAATVWLVAPVAHGQDDPCPQSQRLSALASPGQAFEDLALLVAQHQLCFRSSPWWHRRLPSLLITMGNTLSERRFLGSKIFLMNQQLATLAVRRVSLPAVPSPASGMRSELPCRW